MGEGSMKPPLYLCVHLPEFPAQAALRLRPELAPQPVVVMAGDPPLEEVCSLNTRAGRMGLARGMTRAELDSFPGVLALRRSAVEERLAKAALLEAAGGFTPRVEVQRAVGSAFVFVLDMTGTSRMFGSPERAAASVTVALKELRFHAQMALSANLHAAVCVAATARRKPVMLAPGREAEVLRALPLAALSLTAAQAETLSLWGLQTLGDLAAIPEEQLVVRLGQEGKRLRLLARGEHPHLLVPEEPVFTLEEFLAFDSPVELLDSLLFVLGPMLTQMVARAQNRALALASVTVKLGLDGGGEHERMIRPALPVSDREVLLKLLHLDLQAHPPSAGVVSVHVSAEPGDRSKVQLGLFSPQLPEASRLDVTLARIAAMVGEKRVGRARMLDAHRPDSFVMERFTVTAARAKENVGVPATASLRRCRPPVRLTVQIEGPRPTGLFLHGRRYTVQEAYGPWRRSGEWWATSVWSHEEWDVRAVTGEQTLLCLLSHDLLQHHWQLEALYD